MNALFFELLIWLTAPGAVRADRASFQTVSFTDLVCGQEGGFTCCLKRPLTAAGEPPPEVPVRVEMPAKFIPRVLGASGATLWGLEDDLDRVTASRDFKALRRGVFQVRASVNVLYGRDGVFDQLDGTGEAGIRRGLERAGQKLVVWKKETLAGLLPALEIVADFEGDRGYALYLGVAPCGTLLINYYHPTTRSAADEKQWERFVAGIKKAGS